LIDVMGRSWLVLTLLTVSATATLATQTADKSSRPQLSKLSRSALDGSFKDWELATLDPRVAECRGASDSPPTLVEGDFNADGVQDSAVAIKTPKGVRLVAVFTRLKEGVAVDVDGLGDSVADGYLAVVKRGTSYRNPGDHLDDYFATDTLIVSRCGQSRTAYLWTGVGFRKIVLGA
jgi:hypothetical protein